MTARLLPLVLPVAAGVTGMARQRVVTGTVVSKKDRQPLELATARLVLRSDTTHLVAGAVTDSLGRFRLVTEQTEPMRLRVGFVGLTSAGQDLQFPDAETDSVDVGTIQLDGTDMALRAAVVRAVAARVEQQGDTTVFNASAFRTAEGATLEALIKQLPGAEVSDDGTIKINGKTVKELLINGKDFFKGDTKVAMKNLPTNLVSRVKSYDKKSDYAEQTGVDDGEESFVLDISTKRELNQSFVSNTDVAGGVDDEGSALYSAKFMGMRFTDRSRVGLIASHNNVGDRGFGGPRGFSMNNGGRTTSTMIGTDFSWENGRGKYDAGRFEVGGNALYFRNDNRTETISSIENFVTATQKGSFDAAHAHANSLSQAVHARLRLKWNPDSLTQLSFRPSYEWSKGRTTGNSRSATFDTDPFAHYGVTSVDEVLTNVHKTRFVGDTVRVADSFLKNVNTRYDLSRTTTHKVEGDLNLTRLIGGRNGRNIAFEARGGYNTTANDAYSRADLYKRVAADATGPRMAAGGTHQYTDRPSTSWNYRVGLSYVQPLARKIFLETRYSFQHKYTDGDRSLYNLMSLDGYSTLADFLSAHTQLGTVSQLYVPGTTGVIDWLDPAQLLSRLNADDVQAAVRDAQNSQYATYRYDNHRVQVGLRYNVGAVRLSAGVQLSPERTRLQYERAAIGRIDTVRNVLNFAPNVRFRYAFSKTTNLDFNYRGRSSQPSMTQLIGVVDNSNPLRISVGNPGLRPVWNHGMNLYYNSYNAERLQGLMAHADFNLATGSISQLTVYDDVTGRRFTRPENIDGNWNAAAGLTFNTPLDREKVLNLSTSTDANFTRSVSYVASSAAASALPDAPSLREVNALFAGVTADKSRTAVTALSERLDLSYRRSWWDLTLNGRVAYQHSNSSLLTAARLDTWSFAYGAAANFTLPWGMTFSTDLRMTSRRGFSAAEFNTNELEWNASISQSMLKDKALTLRLEAFDLLGQQSEITRSLTALTRTDAWTNMLNQYVMLHAIYRLNIFGGAKLPERPEGHPGGERPGGNFRPMQPGNNGGRPGGGPGGGGPRF